MNKKCHWSLASYLMGDGSWRLHGFALKLGSIMPDILVHTYWAGHKHETTAEKVETRLNDLMQNGTWTLGNCFKMGYNLHFLEDYFTHPHNSNFEGGFIAHCWYEHRLSKAMGNYLRSEERPVPVLSAGSSIRTVLESRHAEYMAAAPSPESDVQYIVSAAAAVAQELFDSFNRRAVTPRSLAFMERAGMAV